jgi:hypothetical protein
MNAYQPQPGSVAARALAHLASLGDGAEVSTSQLAEALNCSSGILSACLATAIKYGVVKSRRNPGTRLQLFSLMRAAPGADLMAAWTTAPAASSEVIDPVDEEEMADAVAACVPAEPPAAPMPGPTVEHPPSPGPVEMFQPEPPAFLCAIWSDGRLELQRNGQALLLLTADETRTLVEYISPPAKD